MRASATAFRWSSKYCIILTSAAEIKLTFDIRTKALLFALVRAFEFELAVKPEQIKKKGEIVQRPFLKDTLKPEMPLIIKAYRA